MSKKKFDREFKLNAIVLMQKQRFTVKQVSQDLGIGESTLQRWCREFKGHGKHHAFPGSGHLNPDDERLRKLEKENKILRRERDILKKALQRRKPPKPLQHHSDRGYQYTNDAFQELRQENEIICSMSAAGYCYDNAVTESFFHTLKTECVYHERYENREQAKENIFEYVEVFYNNQRRHSTLGYVSPAEFERRYLQTTLCS